jgi:hypothetical protein
VKALRGDRFLDNYRDQAVEGFDQRVRIGQGGGDGALFESLW